MTMMREPKSQERGQVSQRVRVRKWIGQRARWGEKVMAVRPKARVVGQLGVDWRSALRRAEVWSRCG